MFTIIQTPSFSQGLFGHKDGTSGSVGGMVRPVVMGVVVMMVLVMLSVPVVGLLVAEGLVTGLVPLALVVITVGGMLG